MTIKDPSHVHMFGSAQQKDKPLHEQLSSITYDTLTPYEADLIGRIAARMVDLAASIGIALDKFSLAMDLATVHCNSCPLDLTALFYAGNDNLSHDVIGIARHIDRGNGHLLNGFRPRHMRMKS